MLLRQRLRHLAWVVGLGWPASALATPATTRVLWEGDDQCIDVQALKAGVESRLGRRVFSDAADLVLRGKVRFSGGRAQADLELRTEGSGEGRLGTLVGSRDLDMQGDDCHVLDDSLLLVASIMLDVPREELPAPPAPEDPAPAAEKPRAVPPLTTRLRLPTPRPAADPWQYGLFAGFTTTLGALPLGSYGGDLGLRVEPSGFWPLEVSGGFDRGSASGEDGALRLTAASWALTVCPVDFGLELCVGQRFGAIWATGDELANNRSRRRIRGEIAVGLRWAPRLGSNRLVVGLEGLVPLAQDRYFYRRGAREVELFEVAPVGARLSVGFRLGL